MCSMFSSAASKFMKNKYAGKAARTIRNDNVFWWLSCKYILKMSSYEELSTIICVQNDVKLIKKWRQKMFSTMLQTSLHVFNRIATSSTKQHLDKSFRLIMKQKSFVLLMKLLWNKVECLFMRCLTLKQKGKHLQLSVFYFNFISFAIFLIFLFSVLENQKHFP